jgi:hypothetical protein
MAVVTLSCYGSMLQYRVTTNSTNDYKEMTQYILSNQKPADAATFFTAAAHWSFQYYAASNGAVRAPTIVIPDSSHAAGGLRPFHQEQRSKPHLLLTRVFGWYWT